MNQEMMTRARTKKWDVHIAYGGVDEDLSVALGMWFCVKTQPGATSFVFQKTIGDGISLTNPARGLASIVVNPADTASLPANRESGLYYELVYKNAAGEVYPVAKGKLTVTPNIADIP